MAYCAQRSRKNAPLEGIRRRTLRLHLTAASEIPRASAPAPLPKLRPLPGPYAEDDAPIRDVVSSSSDEATRDRWATARPRPLSRGDSELSSSTYDACHGRLQVLTRPEGCSAPSSEARRFRFRELPAETHRRLRRTVRTRGSVVVRGAGIVRSGTNRRTRSAIGDPFLEGFHIADDGSKPHTDNRSRVDLIASRGSHQTGKHVPADKVRSPSLSVGGLLLPDF